MAILEKIVLENFSAGGKCNLFHHGVVFDYLQKNNFEFCIGNIYGIIGEFGDGGAALSCGITGNTNFYQGKIFIDNEEKTIQDLTKNGWYVGNDLYSQNSDSIFKRKPNIKKNPIKSQIELGIKQTNENMDLYMIQKMFNLSNERINRNIDYVSGERWKMSAAIGFASGKKVFCYPWLNSKDIYMFEEQLLKTIKILLEFGCIVIIPTTKVDNIKRITNISQIILL